MTTRTYVDRKPSINIDRTPREQPAARGEHRDTEQVEVSTDLAAILQGLVEKSWQRLTAEDTKSSNQGKPGVGGGVSSGTDTAVD